MISKGNLYLGNHLDYFGAKFHSMDTQVLFRSFRTKIIQSTTATTSIAIRCTNRIRIERKIKTNRHCEGATRPKQSIVILSVAKNPKIKARHLDISPYGSI